MGGLGGLDWMRYKLRERDGVWIVRCNWKEEKERNKQRVVTYVRNAKGSVNEREKERAYQRACLKCSVASEGGH